MSDPQQPVWVHPRHVPIIRTSTRAGSSLSGFFGGVAWLVVVPGLLLSLVHPMAPDHDSVAVLTVGVATFAIPLVLLLPDRTHRFAAFMLAGIVVTAVVVAAVVTAFVIWVTSGQVS